MGDVVVYEQPADAAGLLAFDEYLVAPRTLQEWEYDS